MAFNALIPLMTVVNFSVQETFGDNVFTWAGVQWFERGAAFRALSLAPCCARSLFTAIVLAIEIPLGLGDRPDHAAQGPVGLRLPGADVAAAAHSVERRRLHVEHHGAARYRPARPRSSTRFGIDYNYTRQPIAAWFTIVLMDVWHWTSLVALLCYAGLVSIPDAYYQAAKVDGARPWAVFRYIQLPKLKHVLTIAVLAALHGQFHDLYRSRQC